jgi:hypothetical protein
MQKFSIGVPIELQKFVETRALVTSSSGGGKSWAIRKMVESIGNNVQQIVIDPEGEFASIREKFNFALVSKNGDIPLNLKHAETLAKKLLETGLSAIIDLYELPPRDRVLFVAKFLTALINVDKSLWHPCIIYVDEADKFAPEKGERGSAEALAPVINLCAMGRKRGFCPVLATQRVSKLSKDATAELSNVFIGRTVQDIDRTRAGNELGFNRKEDFLSLRQLKPGEFYAFGPAISDEIQKFKVGPVITTHSKAGKRAAAPPPTPTAIKKVLKELADIPQEAEKELITQQQLRTEIRRLEDELKKANKLAGAGGKETNKSENLTNEIIQLKAQKNNLQTDLSNAKAIIVEIRQRHGDVLKAMGAINRLSANINDLPDINVQRGLISSKKDIKTGNTGKKAEIKLGPASESTKSKPNISKPVSSDNGQMKLPPGEEATLIACAQYPDGLRRIQLSVITQYAKSSRDSYIARLKEKGLVDQKGDRIVPTEAGIERLGNDFKKLPTGSDLQEHWLKILPPGEKAILEILLEEYPNAVIKETLSDRTGYAKSSRDSYIARLLAKEIIANAGKGQVKASEYLFDN